MGKPRVDPEKFAPLTDLEKSLVAKLSTASFPPATATKRFAADLAEGHIRQLTDKGRRFLAFTALRFRRQYTITQEERAWIDHWLALKEEVPNGR